MNTSKSENLNYDEASQFTGISKNTLYAKVSRKEIPHIRLGGRLVRFSRSELEAWINQHRVPVTDGSESRTLKRK